MKFKDIRSKLNNSISSFFKIYINDKDVFYTNDLLIGTMNYRNFTVIKMNASKPTKKDIEQIKKKYISFKKIQCLFEIYLKEV